MNQHTSERHLVVLENTFQDQCEVEIEIKKTKKEAKSEGMNACCISVGFTHIHIHPHIPPCSSQFGVTESISLPVGAANVGKHPSQLVCYAG